MSRHFLIEIVAHNKLGVLKLKVQVILTKLKEKNNKIVIIRQSRALGSITQQTKKLRIITKE